jgi:hypothetical protein
MSLFQNPAGFETNPLEKIAHSLSVKHLWLAQFFRGGQEAVPKTEVSERLRTGKEFLACLAPPSLFLHPFFFLLSPLP